MSNRVRLMKCKRCGEYGYTSYGTETSKSGICPDCRKKEREKE